MGITVLGGRAVAGKPSSALRALSEAFLGASRAVELPQGPELEPLRPYLGRIIPEWRSPEDLVDEGPTPSWPQGCCGCSQAPQALR